MSDPHITEIRIHPIKSTAGIALEASRVRARGLDLDRRWMIVGEDGNFLTGREYPRLILVRSAVEDQFVKVRAPGMTELLVPCDGPQQPAREVQIWGRKCRAITVSTDCNKWFSEFLRMNCELVHMGEDCVRPIDSAYSQPGDEVSFADGFPLLLITEPSLADLNGRLSKPVLVDNFRPNVVVSGCEAFAEDGWKEIRIGEVVFDVAKACSRCVFTTVDPTTGIKSPSLEPLRTLSKYRRRSEGGVYFGQNLIPRTAGTIRLDDRVQVIEPQRT